MIASSQKPVILLLSRDPGGANTLIPLIDPLKAEGFKVKLYGKDVALHKYRESGYEGQDITAALPVISPDTLEALLQKERASLVLTGTSGDDPIEKQLWEAARKLGIPSAAILDQWMNYGIRFSPYGVSQMAAYRANPVHDHAPDRILVMDDLARNEMLALGFSPDQVTVSGQPYFEWVRRQWAALTPADILAHRTRLGITADETVLTFVSEPLSQILAQSGGSTNLGYTEKSIFRELLSALQQCQPPGENLTLLIKLHPRESANNYQEELQQAPPGLRFLVDQQSSPWEVLAISDALCGMSSMLLIEAFLIGKPVASLQIGLSVPDPFILSNLGVLPSVTVTQDVPPVIQSLLSRQQSERGHNFPAVQQPVAGVLTVIRQMLGKTAPSHS